MHFYFQRKCNFYAPHVFIYASKGLKHSLKTIGVNIFHTFAPPKNQARSSRG